MPEKFMGIVKERKVLTKKTPVGKTDLVLGSNKMIDVRAFVMQLWVGNQTIQTLIGKIRFFETVVKPTHSNLHLTKNNVRDACGPRVVPMLSLCRRQEVFLWPLSIIFDILKAPAFRKLWVFSALYLALPRSAMIYPTIDCHWLKCFRIYRLKCSNAISL